MATYFVSRARSIGLVLTALLGSAPAAAQGANDGPANLQHATMLSGFVGAAPAGSTLAPAAGGAIGWQLVPRFGLEARGYWLQPGAASNAFAATVALRVALRPGARLAPFGMAGVGLYNARFDTTIDGVPEFYRGRLTAAPAALPGAIFTDPVVSFGGGADLRLSRHVALRPEANVLLVTTRSAVRAVPVYGIQLVFHFESTQVIR